jgi:hypothetical protein
MASELFRRVKSGCLFHDGINWDCHPCLEFALANLCDAINDINKKLEVTDEFDKTYNQVTVQGEAAIIQHDIEQSQLTIDQAIRLGYIKGPISGTGVEPGGVVTPSDGSDRPTRERKNSVGWRRRGEVANELGILHEEGGDQ